MPAQRPLLCTSAFLGAAISLTCVVPNHVLVTLPQPPRRKVGAPSLLATAKARKQLWTVISQGVDEGHDLCDGSAPALRMSQTALSQVATPRRALFLSTLIVSGLASTPACALQAVEVEFNVDLPSSKWKVKTQIKQAIRLTKEKIYEAVEKSTGASVSVVRTPIALSGDRGGSDRLQELSGAFDESAPKSKEDVVDVLTRTFSDPAARRQRQWMSVERLPDIEDYKGFAGQRYVSFSYDVRECKGTIIGYKDSAGNQKEDCDGNVLPFRRHFVTATVMPTVYTSMRKQEGESDRSKLVDSLWLLDASVAVDDMKTGNVGAALEKVARSFSVTPPAMENMKRCNGKTMTECFGEAWSGRGTLYRGTDRASLSDTAKLGGANL